MTNSRRISDATHALLELRRVGKRLCDSLAEWSGPRVENASSPLADYLAECQAQLRALTGPIPEIDQRVPTLSAAEETQALERFIDAVRESAADAPTRIVQFGTALGLCRLELDLVLLAALPEESSLFGTLFAFLSGQSGARRPTVQLALNFCAAAEEREAALRALCASGLVQTGLLRLEPVEAPLADRMLCLAPEAWPALCGIEVVDPLLGPVLQRAASDAAPPVLPQAQFAEVQALAKLVATGQVKRVVVAGLPGSGRRTVARWLAARAGWPLVEFSISGQDTNARWIPAAIRHALLRNAGMLLVAEPGVAEVLPLPLSPPSSMLCILCLPGRSDVSGPGFTDAVRLSLELPKARERARLWAQALGPAGGPEPAQLARRYYLSGGEICTIAAAARAHALLRQRSAPTDEDVTAALHKRPVAHLEALAQRRRPSLAWEDLVAPAATMAQLEELVSRVTYRDQVFYEWGLSPGARQTGTVAVFVGPSGTGKTLAAEVLTARLGLELYCIDLSRVVSKYIGETERNLARVFDVVEGTGAVLFFDEADALFGRRTETRDAHDRYANLEVSYLLNRLESFAGLAVLASNLRQNMDQAFLRRFDFIVEFTAPDQQARQKLWQRHLRSQAPVDRTIDLAWLAETFAVSGGHIRNVVVAAAFRAASSGGVITMDHLIAAMRREYEKLGKAFPASA